MDEILLHESALFPLNAIYARGHLHGHWHGEPQFVFFSSQVIWPESIVHQFYWVAMNSSMMGGETVPSISHPRHNL